MIFPCRIISPWVVYPKALYFSGGYTAVLVWICVTHQTSQHSALNASTVVPFSSLVARPQTGSLKWMTYVMTAETEADVPAEFDKIDPDLHTVQLDIRERKRRALRPDARRPRNSECQTRSPTSLAQCAS
jgi:hypothetical protein